MIEPSVLQKHSFFGGLLREDVEAVLSLMETADYEAGDNILVEGTPNDRISFILEGKVAVVKEGLTLAELGVGSTFGEMEVLDIMPSAASIKAMERTRVISITNRALHTIYKSDQKVYAMLIMNLARDLSRRLRNMNEKAAGLR